MSFSTGCRKCKKCGKMYLMSLFDGGLCAECERAEQELSGETVSLEVFKQVMWERDIAIEQLHELGYDFGQKIEPCDDAISRQAVLDALYALCDTGETLRENPWRDNPHIDVITDAINNLQSVNPQENERNCVTCKWSKDGHNAGTEECHLCMWESQYKPKTGHWIEKDGFDGDVYYDCSECGESWSTIEGTPWDNGMKYCPNCGARMTESEGEE